MAKGQIDLVSLDSSETRSAVSILPGEKMACIDNYLVFGSLVKALSAHRRVSRACGMCYLQIHSSPSRNRVITLGLSAESMPSLTSLVRRKTCLHGWKKLRPTIQLEARWPKSLFLAPAKARLIITTGGQIGHQGIRTMNDPRNESHLCNGVMQDEALGLTVLDGVVNLVQLRRLITVQTRRFGTAV